MFQANAFQAPTFGVQCKCGARVAEGVSSKTAAEVLADRHESANIRRAYRHDAVVLQEAR